jgi:hypothetical protein
MRNPYTRLLSCYINKFHEAVAPEAPIIRRLRGGSAPDSFAAFVRQVVQQTDRQMDRHWRPQVTNLYFSRIRYAFIGRFEEYAGDFARAFAAIGVNCAVMPALRHLNRSQGPGGRLRDFYDDELQALVYGRYREDFETFGYGPEVPG